MKKIERLVLNQIAKKELSQRQIGKIKGGRFSCACCCSYAGGGTDSLGNGYGNCENATTCSSANIVVSC